MNPDWFGDSYDIVKRFFVGTLKREGFSVFVNPMFTGDWKGLEDSFYSFIDALPYPTGEIPGPSAVLLDPDTGIGKTKTERHMTVRDVADEATKFSIVFCFDQSFSRGQPQEQMEYRLRLLRTEKVYGFYYNSHAKFLFAGRDGKMMGKVELALAKSGLPKNRLFHDKST